MEDEEEAVEICDFFADAIDLVLLEGDPVEDELFFFEPLLQEELVGWGFCDLVKWVHGFGVHD